MTPRVLVIRCKFGIVEAVPQNFGAQPVTWVEAGIVQVLRDFPVISLAGIGVGLHDKTRERVVGGIAVKASHVSIRLKDIESDAGGIPEFLVKLIPTFFTPKEVVS